MVNQRDLDRQNDMRLLTPLLLMATILAFGILAYAFTGHALAAGGERAVRHLIRTATMARCSNEADYPAL